MLTRILCMVFLLTVAAGTASGQSSKKKKKDKRNAQTGQPTSLDPSYFPQMDYTPEKAKRKRSKGITYSAEARYYERREEVAKQKRKAEKEMAKPQYSDPTYFGHKRPPKKRKPGKMKYCKVCGIRH